MHRPIVPLPAGPTILRRRAQSVRSPAAVRSTIADLYDTWPTVAGLGIAAPQIGVGRRLFIFCRHHDANAVPEVLINPKVIRAVGDLDDYEGCLSVAGVYGRVVRAAELEISAFTPDFARVRLRFTGYDARIIQHEMDHLDGVVYLDRVTEWDSFLRVAPLSPENTPEDSEERITTAPLEASEVETLRSLMVGLPGYALRW